MANTPVDKLDNEGDMLLTKKSPFDNFVREWGVTIIIVLSLAIVLFCVIGIVPVQGRSMMPVVESYGEENNYVLTLRHADYDRGDIIIIDHGGTHLIKRVIAVEGDEVSFSESVEGGVVVYKTVVNGETIEEDYIYEPMTEWHTSYERAITVGEGEIYVMGDNRNESGDSRDFGVMKAEDYLGKVFLILNRSGWIWI